MFHRLTFPQLLAVRRALQAGLRHVEIAREFQLGVWTVDRIAALERYATDSPTEADLIDDDAPPDYVPANLHRCPSCGAMVYVWPCLACRLAVSTRQSHNPESHNPESHHPESSCHDHSAANHAHSTRAHFTRALATAKSRPPSGSFARSTSERSLSDRHRMP